MKSTPKGIRFPSDIEAFVEKQMKKHGIRKFGTMVIKLLTDLKKSNGRCLR